MSEEKNQQVESSKLERFRAFLRNIMCFFIPKCDSTDGANVRSRPWHCFFGFLRNIFSRSKRRQESQIYPRLDLPPYDLHFEYNMNHRHRGVAMIFNHENFTDLAKTQRRGTDKDRDRLKGVLTKFGFQVEVFNDLSFKSMQRELKRVSQMDHSSNDCLLITIMTHGDLGTVSSHDEDYAIEVVTSYFTDESCPTLTGKPRLFFIQACRGSLLDSGHTVRALGNKTLYTLKRSNDSNDTTIPYEKIPKNTFIDQLHTPPNHQDFLVVRSTMPNHLSFRNPDTGSWFIQDLCNELEENGTKYDILNLLTHVNWSISQRESVPFGKKQILCISTMLTKILYFNIKTIGLDNSSAIV